MSKPNSIFTVARLLQGDAARYSRLGGWYQNLGFWIGATYRLHAWAQFLPSPVVRIPILIPLKAISEVWHTIYNVKILPGARIGEGLCLIHPRNVMIGSAEIGMNCLIFHEVTLGTNASSLKYPTIGNNVDIYVGARVLGGIQVGNNAKIGANCVVDRNIAEGTTVVPAANRVIPATVVNNFGPRHSKTGATKAK